MSNIHEKAVSDYPDSAAISASRSADSLVLVAGLRTTVLPAASAGHNFHDNNISGKFQGTMAPTTPVTTDSID